MAIPETCGPNGASARHFSGNATFEEVAPSGSSHGFENTAEVNYSGLSAHKDGFGAEDVELILTMTRFHRQFLAGTVSILLCSITLAQGPPSRVCDVEVEIKPPGRAPPSSPRSGC